MIVQAPLHNRKERRAIANGLAFSESRAYYQQTVIDCVESGVFLAFMEDNSNLWGWWMEHRSDEDSVKLEAMLDRADNLFDFTH